MTTGISKSMYRGESVDDYIERQLANFNYRICLIKTIFDRERLLGIDKVQERSNKYYYNDRFDFLYSKDIYVLESIDLELEGIAEHYFKFEKDELKPTV